MKPCNGIWSPFRQNFKRDETKTYFNLKMKGHIEMSSVHPRNKLNLFFLFTLILLLVSVRADNTRKFVSEHLNGDGTTMTEMMDYMTKFGYLPKSSDSLISHLVSGDEISNAIQMVQRVANLPETGILDDVTARHIKRRRCGVSDAPLIATLRRPRTKRYVIHPAAIKWTKKTLTWRLEHSTSKVGHTQVLLDLGRAFRLWSDASSLSFLRVERGDQADIVVSFEHGDHGDGYRFDGQGSILAHAFPPTGASNPISGDMHMDDEENWKAHQDAKDSPERATSIFIVAAHELGHSLGLAHSADTKALMFEGYSGPVDHQQLPEDDRQAIQILYGPNTGTGAPSAEPAPYPPRQPHVNRPVLRATIPPNRPWTPDRRRPPYVPNVRPTAAPTPPTAPNHGPDLCRVTFDAVAAIRGELYIFKDKYMWRLTAADELYGPMLITSYWVGLPEDLEKIDAAYEKPTAGYDIVLFSGNRYWTFNGRHSNSRQPQYLGSLGLPPRLSRLDATLVWGHNGKTYFFSGDHYWKFDEVARRVMKDYPKPITAWEGIRHPINSALRWKDGTTYFFKDKLFWKFNDTEMKMDHPTGRLTNAHWFNCPDTGRTGKGDEDTNSVNGRRHASVVAENSSPSSLRHVDPSFIVILVILTGVLKRR